MNKKLNKLVAITTVGVVLSVPMISNAKNVVCSSNVATSTPSTSTETPKELTKADFKPAIYYVGEGIFTIADVDDFVNPKYFWDDYYDEDHPIKNFENVNEFIKESSKIEDYVPEGYIFKGWKVDGMDEDCPEITVVRAILEKDQAYIDNMDFSCSDVKVVGIESCNYVHLACKLSDNDYKVVSASADNDEYGFHYTFMENNNTVDINREEPGDRKWYEIPDDYVMFNLGGFVHTFNCDKYSINIVLENKLGKQLKITETVDKNDTVFGNNYNSGGKIYNGPNDIKMEYVSDVTVGSRIYFYNIPEKVFKTLSVKDSFSHIDISSSDYKKGVDSKGHYIEIVKDYGDSISTKESGFYNGCLLTIYDGTGRTYTNNIVYHSPELIEENPSTETPVEPATKTPVVEPATETPSEEEKPVVEEPATETPATKTPATETPKEEKPQQPTKTSDSSSIAVVLSILALSVVAVDKTKKKN